MHVWLGHMILCILVCKHRMIVQCVYIRLDGNDDIFYHTPSFEADRSETEISDDHSPIIIDLIPDDEEGEEENRAY